jgi:hypothetical protein
MVERITVLVYVKNVGRWATRKIPNTDSLLLGTERTKKYSEPRLNIMTEIVVRQLTENDISTADRIRRLAFGTFVGLHDPMQFFRDADPIHNIR